MRGVRLYPTGLVEIRGDVDERRGEENLLKLAKRGCHLMQPRVHLREDAARLEFAAGAAFAGADAGEDFDSLLDGSDGVDVESALHNRFDHFIA